MYINIMSKLSKIYWKNIKNIVKANKDLKGKQIFDLKAGYRELSRQVIKNLEIKN